MPIYIFDPEKNLILVKKRNIGFEEIIAAIENEQILEITQHPNQEKYPNQKIYFVHIRGYIYLVPFVTDNDGNIFLKTIIPSRKAKRKYLEENKL